MNKSILKIAILFSIFSIILISCNKDEIDTPETSTGQYTVVMDGKTIATGTTIEVGLLENLATVSEGENFSILVGAIPVETGGVSQFDESNSTGTVTIMGKNLLLTDESDEMYFSNSGSVKRESSTKISFEGTCKAMLSTTTHTFSGTIESDAFKQLN